MQLWIDFDADGDAPIAQAAPIVALVRSRTGPACYYGEVGLSWDDGGIAHCHKCFVTSVFSPSVRH
jgi:hypothetical protein